MNLFEHMDALAHTFTKTDHYIYTKCKKFTSLFAEGSIAEITKNDDISQAALTRFAKKLGFNGFNEFQFALAMQIKEGTIEGKEKTPAHSYAETLIETEKTLTDKVLQPILNKLKMCNDIYTSGIHMSSLPARYLDYYFKISCNYHSEFLSIDSFPSSFKNNSILFLFSVESGTYFQTRYKEREKEENIPYIVLITLNPKHPLRKKVNHTIVLPHTKMVDSDRNVLPETLSFLMFIDVLTRKLQIK